MKEAMKLFALILIMICTSCKSKMTRETFTNDMNQVFSVYRANDIRAAEKALLDGLQTVSRYESTKTEGLDFDAGKALLHERLFLIYRNTHETNKMVIEFQKSMECTSRSRRRWGEPLGPAMSYEEFAQKLDLRERGANVAWKTNAESEYLSK